MNSETSSKVAYLALGANAGFRRTSCGYVGVSDGWQDLSDNFKLDWEFERAEDGNVAVTAQIDVAKNEEFTVGLGHSPERAYGTAGHLHLHA